MPIDDALHPDRQEWALGDRLWMYPADRAGGAGFATLRVYTPGRALGFATRMTGTPLDGPENGSWSFALEPAGPTSTRLLIRGRGTSTRSLVATAFDRSVFEPLHYAMERRMMIGLKEIAESGTRHRLANHVQVLLWTLTFVMVLVGAARVAIGWRWMASLVLFVTAASAFELLTLVQPPLWVGVPTVLLLGLMVAYAPDRQFFAHQSRPGLRTCVRNPSSIQDLVRAARPRPAVDVEAEERSGKTEVEDAGDNGHDADQGND